MRYRGGRVAGASCMIALLAVCGAGLVQAQGEDTPGGPLGPDLPAAKGYNDAAKALATIDDNPVIRWEHRVWCETGHRHVSEVGLGQQVDQPADMTRDHFSRSGFHHMPTHDQWMPRGGARFMDNAWYVGNEGTGSVVVRTPDGLLVFDTLRHPDEFERVLHEMPAAGLDPGDIKFVFIGHSHNDHLAGVNAILKAAPQAKVVAGEPDRQLILRSRAALVVGPPYTEKGAFYRRNHEPKTKEEIARYHAIQLRAVPERVDIGIAEQPGLKTGIRSIRVGRSTDVLAVLAPGHTDGQTHYIVPVQHRGGIHKLLVWSGNDQVSNARQYAISVDYVRSVAAAAGADALINTHGYQSAFFHHVRRAHADPAGPNPILMGADGVDRYLGIFADCQRAMRHRLKDGTWKRG